MRESRTFGSEQGAAREGKHYRDFWAYKYSIAVVYSGLTPESLRGPRDRSEFRSVSGLARDIVDEAEQTLTPSERHFVTWIHERPAGSAYGWEGVQTRWKEAKDKDRILYFLAHMTGTEVSFSDDDRVGVTAMRMWLSEEYEDREGDSYSIMFLNGCSSAVNELDRGFFDAASRYGFCGLIGSEAQVPTEFAVRYGAALVDEIWQSGKTLREILHDLLTRHWPVSIFYGCYANPDYHVEAPDAGWSTPWLSGQNFSAHERGRDD